MERVVFIKPTTEVTCYVVTQLEKERVRLLEVWFTPSVDYGKAVSLSLAHDADIRYDGTLFMEDGKAIRGLLERNVFIYKSIGKLEDRAVRQAEWIKKNVIYPKEYTGSADFVRFVSMLTSYSVGDDLHTVAVDVLSDVSRYYRRVINNEEI